MTEHLLSPEVAKIMAAWKRQQAEREAAFYALREHQRAVQAARLNPQPPPMPSPPRCTVTRNNGIETVALVSGRGPRMIHGVVTTPTTTTNGNRFRPLGCRVRMPVPLLSAHHKQGRVGWVTLVRKSEQQVYVQAALDDTDAALHAWELVRDGILRALSAGAAAGANADDYTVVEGVKFYRNWQLREVSLVRVGANRDAICEPLR